MSIGRILLNWGRYDIDGDKVFLVVQENTLNKAENDRFEHHKRYADLHLLVEGHEFSSYGSRVTGEAIAFDEASDIGFVHCQESYPLHLGYHNFAIFFPGEPHQPNGYAGQEDIVKNIYLKLRSIDHVRKECLCHLRGQD